jgi:DNA-binding beta-propeller fold protein YncE
LIWLSLPCWALAENVAERLGAARPGSTVELPAGTFRAGDLTPPDGVGLRGAGYGKTILDASGFENGLLLRGKLPASVSDLTITGATQAGIVVDGAANLTLERVAVRGCGSALVVNKANGCILQNLVLADNKSGVSLSNSANTALTNATIADSDGTGVRVNGCDKLAIFNNLVVRVPYGIAVGSSNSGLAIDHNLYIANFVGQLQGEPTRKKVESWYHLTGHDKHSLTIGVTFRDPANGDYRPVSPLSWAPVRATCSDWGTAKLGGFQAPKRDIDGAPRSGNVDLGAYEVTFPAPRPPDGQFKVKSGVGVASAALFTPDDRCVRYLFQNLPLAKGAYDYWLPSRDWQGRAIPTGDYHLRVTEADLRLEYVAAAGNGDLRMSTTELGSVSKRVSLDPHAAAFDAAGRLVVAQSGFESGQHVRAYDAEMTRFVWSFPGGGQTVGMAVDIKGRVLVMRKPNSLLRLDSATGQGAPFANGSIAKTCDAVKSANGMAVLGDRAYVADPSAGKVVVLAGEELDVAASFDVASPTQPAADTKTGLIWVISAEKELVALNDKGGIRQRATPVEQPKLLAAANGVLAVYSAASNKIHLFDSSDPAKLNPLRTIGTGGDGFGPIRGDRFWGPKYLAVSGRGELAVIDAIRTIFFAADGTVKRHHIGMWGQGISYGRFADGLTHFFNIGGGYDIVLNAKARQWVPGTRWRYTMPLDNPYFLYSTAGRNFGLFPMTVKDKGSWLAIVRMEDDGTGRVLTRYGWDKDGLYRQRDPDADGFIRDEDPVEPVTGPDGKRYVDRFMNRGFWNIDFRADGSIVQPDRPGVRIVPMTGLDAAGVPQYDFAKARFFPGTVEDGKPSYVSPYDFKTSEAISIAEDMFLEPDGSFAAVITTKSGPGPDMCTEHANGTSMAGFDAGGRLRWLSPMNPYGLKMGFYGITTIGGITFAGRGAICEFETMDHDGLGTGVLGMPKEFGWGGMWLDNHRQTQGFTGNDGKPYLVVGDYAAQTYHWLKLKGWDKMTRKSTRVKVSASLAETLAKAEPVPVPVWPVPAPPRVTLKKLSAPLAIDGDPAKWRSLGIQPLVAISDAPASNSCVLRMAYEGENIYVQAIKFDDLLTFHQSEPGKHYLQDGIEFSVNTFMEGWKYNITKLVGTGDAILRDRWGGGKLIDATVAPRAIRTYDTAEAFPERKMIEAATGLDLRQRKVLVAEFKLTKDALAGLPANRQVVFGSGKTFLFGFMINDNDTPGADTLNPLVWPVTYGTFERDDRYATAVFE